MEEEEVAPQRHQTSRRSSLRGSRQQVHRALDATVKEPDKWRQDDGAALKWSSSNGRSANRDKEAWENSRTDGVAHYLPPQYDAAYSQGRSSHRHDSSHGRARHTSKQSTHGEHDETGKTSRRHKRHSSTRSYKRRHQHDSEREGHTSTAESMLRKTEHCYKRKAGSPPLYSLA